MPRIGKFPVILPFLAGFGALTACASGYDSNDGGTLGVPRDGRGEPILNGSNTTPTGAYAQTGVTPAH